MQIAAEHILRTKEKLNRILAERCGKEPDQLRIDSDRNNWMSADEALNYGLIDKIIDHRG